VNQISTSAIQNPESDLDINDIYLECKGGLMYKIVEKENLLFTFTVEGKVENKNSSGK